MKNDRLFQLLYLLLENGSMTAPVLAKKLEVSVRTIYRDVDTLSASGIPVYTLAGKGGGIALMPGYSFDKTLLSAEEQDKLLFAVQSLKAADQQVDILLQKLGGTFKRPKNDWICVEFSRWGMHDVDTRRFELLKTAILCRQVLKITYCGSSGEKSSRDIHPLRLIYKDKNWYLQTYCMKSDDFRLFKLSRMIDVFPTGEIYTQDYADDIPPLEAQHLPGVGTSIKLRFAPSAAYRVYDEYEHSSITQEADGCLLVEVDFPMDNWVIGYLFSFGTEVEILEPLTLKEELARYAEQIADHHRT